MAENKKQAEIELEFTYLADGLPIEIKGIDPKRLIDVYIPETGVEHPTLRLRNKAGKLEITRKSPITEGDSSAQYEMTIPLSQQEYDALSNTSDRRVVKDRYEVCIDGYPAEVDVFQEKLKGLVLIDFEFDNEEKRNSFKAPLVCLADVTQEEFIAGGLLAGKGYDDIAERLKLFNYAAIL